MGKTDEYSSLLGYSYRPPTEKK
ncbi:hypothetical protein KIPB_008680, partial [Kipferlia bialata]|eukprot:g8680.t1